MTKENNYSTLKDFLEEIEKLGSFTEEEFKKFMLPRNHETLSIDDVDEKSMKLANKSTIQFIKDFGKK